MLGINNTFGTKLFESPDPKNAELYKSFFDSTFPDASDFIAFLGERNQEERAKYAKRILLRLAAESHFFPPNRLLYNLLEFESYVAGNRKRESFVGRDHFNHLVSLYLLGIYL